MRRVATAWVDGWKRVAGAPWILAGVMTLTVASAIPFAIVMRSLLMAHLERSLVAVDMADGVNYDWWQEFLSSQEGGVGSTFSPRILGFAATLDSLSALADMRTETAPIAALLLAYVLVWTYLGAGIIDRYARQRPTRARGFAAACGAHALGFSVLALFGAIAYGLILGYVHPWLLDTRYVRLTQDLDSERAAFAWRVAMYTIVGALTAGANLILDYAKIRMVVEDRRSATGSLVAALRFLFRNPTAAAGLYLLNTVTCAALLAAWAGIAPSTGPAGLRAWLAFALGQGFITARLASKLHFLASQTALFQRRLAHDRFTAAPLYRWPDAPVVETLAAPASGGHAPAI
jgi:hypothetical protein